MNTRYGAGDRTRSAFFSPSAGEKNRGRHQFLNWCRQVSAGHLHFDGFSPGQDQKREEGITFLSFLVPVTGLEPVRCRQRWILSPLRLPFHHTGRNHSCLHSVGVTGCGARYLPRLSKAIGSYRPLPIAQVASSATGGAPIAPHHTGRCLDSIHHIFGNSK